MLCRCEHSCCLLGSSKQPVGADIGCEHGNGTACRGKQHIRARHARRVHAQENRLLLQHPGAHRPWQGRSPTLSGHIYLTRGHAADSGRWPSSMYSAQVTSNSCHPTGESRGPFSESRPRCLPITSRMKTVRGPANLRQGESACLFDQTSSSRHGDRPVTPLRWV